MSHAIPRAEHPRPDFMRPLWVNLNGEWQFAFDDANVGQRENWQTPGKAFDKKIIVPFCFQCEASGINDETYHPIMWYRRSFAVPAEMQGKRILLRFGAVDFACEVFVNGRTAGSHKGGYTPFALDITPFLTDGENDLCVRVEDYHDCTQPRGKQLWVDKWFGCWYTPTSGIWQTVYMEAAGDVYVKTAHVTPDIDAGTASLRVTLNEIPAKPVTVKVKVTVDDCDAREKRTSVHNEEERLVREQTMTMTQRSQRMVIDMVEGHSITGFLTWSPDNPHLYNVDIELDTGDQVSTYFGMRKVELHEGTILLNNHSLYQRLVLDQGYWPESLITPPTDDAIRADVEWTKKFGYNGARKHQKLEDPRYYYWADRLGLLVWEEIPSHYEFTNEAIANVSETMTGGIERDYNHPCVITWVPLNESWGVDRMYADKRMQFFADMLYAQCKAMDGTRLVSTNDGWENTKTDIFGLHDYAATGDKLARHFADRVYLEKHSQDHHMAYASGVTPTGKEAFLLTEYGGIAFEEGNAETWGYHDKVTDEESFFKRYQSLTEAARAIPYCQGYVYTQLTDVRQETNGLLTPDRKPKVNVDRFRSLTLNPDGDYVEAVILAN